MVKSGEINMDYSKARYNYIKSINKGLLKILSKMGISNPPQLSWMPVV